MVHTRHSGRWLTGLPSGTSATCLRWREERRCESRIQERAASEKAGNSGADVMLLAVGGGSLV